MNKNKLMLGVLVFLLAIPLVSAVDYYTQDNIADLKYNCFNSTSQLCEVDVNCTLSVYYPNGTVLVDNQPMTNQTAYYNYTLNENQTSVLGDYKTMIFCSDGTESGYSLSTFGVTMNGKEPPPTYMFLAMYIILIGIMIWIIYAFIDLLIKSIKLDVGIREVLMNVFAYISLLAFYLFNTTYVGVGIIEDIFGYLMWGCGIMNVVIPITLFMAFLVLNIMREGLRQSGLE